MNGSFRILSDWLHFCPCDLNEVKKGMPDNIQEQIKHVVNIITFSMLYVLFFCGVVVFDHSFNAPVRFYLFPLLLLLDPSRRVPILQCVPCLARDLL